MKRNDSGDFSVLYVEPSDEKAALFQVISGQKKPVVIMLAEQTQVFQRPDDFATLKHVKRQLDLPVVFVIPTTGHLTNLAARNGFPVYLSMDALADALSSGQLTRRISTKNDSSVNRGNSDAMKRLSLPKKTVPLKDDIVKDDIKDDQKSHKHTEPLIPQDFQSVTVASQVQTATRHQPMNTPLPESDIFPQSPFPVPNFKQATGPQAPISNPKQATALQAPTLPVELHAPIPNLKQPTGPQAPVPLSKQVTEPQQSLPVSNAQVQQVKQPSEPLIMPRFTSRSLSTAPVPTRSTSRSLSEPPKAERTTSRTHEATLNRPSSRTLEEAPVVPRFGAKKLSAPPTPLPMPQAPRTPLVSKRRFPFLLVILAIAIVLGGSGLFLVMAHNQALTTTTTTMAPVATNALVGHIAFTSSEQLHENTSQGIEDQVVMDLNNLPNPAAHKNYYAWLLGDKTQSDPKSIALGTLQVSGGHAHLLYQGDAQHSNLLLLTSRFIVTEEDATVPPISPSPDLTTWRYYGEFSTTPINSPDNTKHFSYLDHLRHLLGADPTLDELELPGGLNNWFYRNNGKLLEWVSSTREQWNDSKDTAFIRRQTIRTLEYLDGTSFVYQDLPTGTPLLVDERLARVGLLEVNGANQEPPSYLNHIVHHLNGLLQSGGATPTLRTNAAGLITSLNNVQFWLNNVRQDALKLLKMNDDELKQPATLTLLNDMIDNTNHAYTGQLDPSTNTMRNGAVWVHDHMQSLSSMDVTKFKPASGTSHQMIPGDNIPKAFTPYGAKNDKQQ